MSAQPAAAQPTLSPPRYCVGHAWLPEAVYAALKDNAQRRGVHPDRLLASIATNVVVNGYVDAILDH